MEEKMAVKSRYGICKITKIEARVKEAQSLNDQKKKTLLNLLSILKIEVSAIFK
jgi:hypothetical protein